MQRWPSRVRIESLKVELGLDGRATSDVAGDPWTILRVSLDRRRCCGTRSIVRIPTSRPVDKTTVLAEILMVGTERTGTNAVLQLEAQNYRP